MPLTRLRSVSCSFGGKALTSKQVSGTQKRYGLGEDALRHDCAEDGELQHPAEKVSMTKHTRTIAIDLGDKRTGLAMADSLTGIVSPAGLLEVSISDHDGEALLVAIAGAIEGLVGAGPAGLVIGLPINMDGTEGPRAKLVRAYAARIAAKTGREVEFQDERQSSMAANERMAQSGLTHKQKKARRDAIAAVVILQRYMDGPCEEHGA